MQYLYKISVITLLSILGMGIIKAQTTKMTDQTIYQYSAKTIEGKDFSFEAMKGKKIMIVNVASKCGLTPQYKELQELYTEYKDSGFEIVGFPANNFMFQEPGDEEKIAAFCEKNYGVEFQMMSKISVKGKKMHPIYEFLTQEEKNGYRDSKVKWNFQKYLIDETGHLVKIVPPTTSPKDEKVLKWLGE